MRADTARLAALRQGPEAAVSRTRPSAELLAQVEQALSVTDIDRRGWHDSMPQPAAPLSGSDYKRHATRLYFESVTFQQLAAFAHDLRQRDPTLRVSSVGVTNRDPTTTAYDVELSVAYLVYAPSAKQGGGIGSK